MDILRHRQVTEAFSSAQLQSAASGWATLRYAYDPVERAIDIAEKLRPGTAVVPSVASASTMSTDATAA
jgi:hypothetical protein